MFCLYVDVHLNVIYMSVDHSKVVLTCDMHHRGNLPPMYFGIE